MIIAVDFDNTLFKTDYPHIKEPMYPTINYGELPMTKITGFLLQ